METKKCSKCGEVKSVEEFYKKRNSYQHMCKDCRVIYHKEWYEENKEKRKNQIYEYKKNNFAKIYEHNIDRSIKRKNKKDLIIIDKNRAIKFLGEPIDLLSKTIEELSKIEKFFIIKNDLDILKKINLIKGVKYELSNRKNR